ncbi:cGMP-dependent protein kinase, isozyme 1 [Gryllus bimaculatus]|nr:cGMP-dependent protein kinase, isozyme 1 [Gryllus bimaculatus]
MMYSCHSAVSSVPFFSDLPLDVMVRIVLCLRNEIFMENEVVVQAGTTGNSMYFIAAGTVVVFSASGNEICHLQDGAFFGEIAMLSGDETRIASVVAVETCELYCLDRDDFLSTVAAHPDLLKRMEETALYRLDQTDTCGVIRCRRSVIKIMLCVIHKWNIPSFFTLLIFVFNHIVCCTFNGSE